MCILSKLVAKKEAAFNQGTLRLNALVSEYRTYINFINSNEEIGKKYIGLNVCEATDFIYKNNSFYDYLKFSFLGKYYERKIVLIEWLIILFFILLGVLSYFLLGFGLAFVIISILLLVILLILFKFFIKTGERYSSYYERTMMNFLTGIYPNLQWEYTKNSFVSDDDLKATINKSYDKKKIFNNIKFTGTNGNGSITDVELTRVYERNTKDGGTRKHEDIIFDGFYIKINTNSKFNMFKGNIIKIRSDETLFSSITEDTFNSIYESEKAISFNSEEMNKSFDAKISGYRGFDSVDDMMIQAQKILTPSFEERLLFLRERYNSFNMNISDNGLTFAVNMKRSAFQQIKHQEFMDFKTTYREANESFRMLRSTIHGISDFTYYNVFPFLERIYFINYLTYLYLSYMDFDNYFNLNNMEIVKFENKMKNIYNMSNKEFKELYTEKIEEIYKNSNKYAKELEKKENKKEGKIDG